METCKCCADCCSHLRVELCWFDEIPEGMTMWDDGILYMKQRLDKSCIALEDKRCSIYQERPQECQDFQCYKLLRGKGGVWICK